MARLLDPEELSDLPSIQWGRTHEKAAGESFLKLKVQNTVIQSCIYVAFSFQSPTPIWGEVQITFSLVPAVDVLVWSPSAHIP